VIILAAESHNLPPTNYLYQNGPLCLSTNGGASWSLAGAPVTNWSILPTAVACSADGSTLVAVAGGGWLAPGPIYVSTNTGAAWFQTSAPAEFWSGAACSADGKTIFAVSKQYPTNSALGKSTVGGVFVSTNSGVTWTQTSAQVNQWQAAACSADGSKVVAIDALEYGDSPNIGGIFLSTNSGATWTLASPPLIDQWWVVSCSPDGGKITAMSMQGATGFQDVATWTSTDSGATWTSYSFVDPTITAMTVSGDGNRAIACGTGVYAWQIPPQLALGLSSNLANFSWPSSAPGYALQQNFDLTTTNWTTITNTPVISGYSNQVVVSPPVASGGNVFYRLVSP